MFQNKIKQQEWYGHRDRHLTVSHHLDGLTMEDQANVPARGWCYIVDGNYR